MRRLTWVIAVFLCCAGTPGVLFAGEAGDHFHDVRFQAQFDSGGVRQTLLGSGIKRFFLIRVFAAGFYAGEGVPAGRVLDDVPKRLEVHYFVGIPATELARETRQRIVRNTNPQEFAKIKERVDVMDRYFKNIKPGDIYALTYIPGVGTQFSYNGNTVGTIEGADFSKALFAVWVGTYPVDRILKDHLLGQLQD